MDPSVFYSADCSLGGSTTLVCIVSLLNQRGRAILWEYLLVSEWLEFDCGFQLGYHNVLTFDECAVHLNIVGLYRRVDLTNQGSSN